MNAPLKPRVCANGCGRRYWDDGHELCPLCDCIRARDTGGLEAEEANRDMRWVNQEVMRAIWLQGQRDDTAAAPAGPQEPRTERVEFRWPASLKRAATAQAKREGRSLSDLVVAVVTSALADRVPNGTKGTRT